jgi:hypothetical protein
MLPLSEPELEDSSEARQGAIKARIGLGSNQRHHPL